MRTVVAIIEMGLVMHLWGATVSFVWEENLSDSHRPQALKVGEIGV